MKSFFLTFFAVAISNVAATSVEQLIVDKYVKERSLRGNLDPRAMSIEEQERETIFLCALLNAFLPIGECTCQNNLLALSIDFVCTSEEENCISLPGVDNLCTTPVISGDVQLALFQLSALITMEGCSANTYTNSSSGEVNELGDVCGSVSAKAGIGGVGVTGCSLEFFGSECSTCENCDLPNNSTGLLFACEILPEEICLPLGLPLLVDEVNSGVGVGDMLNLKVWQDFTVELAKAGL